MAKQVFHFEFDDESASATGRKNDSLSYEVLEEAHLRLEFIEGAPFLWGNRPGFLTLAGILVKMGTSTYKEGFHIQLRRDFSGDAELPDALTVSLSSQ